MMSSIKAFAGAVVLLAATSAGAGEIYKCPNAAGKIEFTDRPCATAAGTKITVQPNSVATQDQSANKEKREAVEKRIADAQASERAEWARREAAHQARVNECMGYIDQAYRQRAWLNSISPAVAQSAANEIDIQNRKYQTARCGEVIR